MVLLSLFMRTNRKCNNSHAPTPITSVFHIKSPVFYMYFPLGPNIPEGPEYEKISLLQGEKFYQLHMETKTAVATSK